MKYKKLVLITLYHIAYLPWHYPIIDCVKFYLNKHSPGLKSFISCIVPFLQILTKFGLNPFASEVKEKRFFFKDRLSILLI